MDKDQGACRPLNWADLSGRVGFLPVGVLEAYGDYQRRLHTRLHAEIAALLADHPDLDFGLGQQG